MTNVTRSIIRLVVSDEIIRAECQIPPNPPLAKGGNFRIVSIVTPNRITQFVFQIQPAYQSSSDAVNSAALRGAQHRSNLHLVNDDELASVSFLLLEDQPIGILYVFALPKVVLLRNFLAEFFQVR